jgi:hypothetical protein
LQAILNSSQVVATARRSPQKGHATEFLFIYSGGEMITSTITPKSAWRSRQPIGDGPDLCD